MISVPKRTNDITIYVAGPMRGCKLLNFPAFDRAAAVLRDLGYQVVNPAEIDRANGIDPKRPETIPANFDGLLRIMLKRDFVAILDQCDAIALLEGWQKSSGARAETAIALALGLHFHIVGSASTHRVANDIVAVNLGHGFIDAATSKEGFLGPPEPVSIADIGVA